MALLSNILLGAAGSASKKNTAKKSTSTASGKGTVKPVSQAPTTNRTYRSPATSNKASSSTSSKATTPTASGSGTAKPISQAPANKNNAISSGRTSTSSSTNNTGSYVGGSSGSSSGGSSGSTNTVPNYQQQLMDYFREQNEKARQSAIDAITQRVATQEGLYNTQIDDLTDQYQALRNQSEVERYKTRSAMRESLANRGQLDSGYGRQENLIMDTQYGNAINSINMQEQKAKDDIRNLISQLKAEAEAEKNQINNQYNQAIAQAMTSLGLTE